MNSFRISLALALVSAPAFATSIYPDGIKSHLGLSAIVVPAAPHCTLCHTNGSAGGPTVNTPFGTSMRQAGGLVGGGNTTKLNAALDALATAKTDSDGDGVSDIDELKAGTDPNVSNGGGADGGTGGSGGTVTSPPPPATYGCGANAVPTLLGLSGLVALSGLLRRRR